MCDILTSCVVKVQEPFEVKTWNISSHSETWEALNIRDGVRCAFREAEWKDGDSEPSIRWREEDDAETRESVISWFLRRWPTCDKFISHCIREAHKIVADRLNGSITAPNAEHLYASGCTKLQKQDNK